MNIGVSPFGRILIGKSKPIKDKPGAFMWTGPTKDITDDAIFAVFDHMAYKAKETGQYSISCEQGALSMKLATPQKEGT